MSSECKCGYTTCLSCLGTCPYCGDDISNHIKFDEAPDRRVRLKRLLEKGT